MSDPVPPGRFQWRDLPAAAQNAVSKRIGHVLAAESTPAGMTVGIASRLRTESSYYFLKAIPVESPAVDHFRAELEVSGHLPAALGSPALRCGGEIAGWLLLVFDHVPGREADLSPGSTDIPGALDLLATLPDTLTPSPWADAPEITATLGPMAVRARQASSQPAALPADVARVATYALDSLNLAAYKGDTLLHGDVHAGNLVVVDDRVVLLDWSLAARGAPWLDTVRLVPRLIAAGHTPAKAEALVCSLPVWAEAPDAAVTGLAALWTLFAAHMAIHGPTRLRGHRECSMAAGADWLRHRAGAA